MGCLNVIWLWEEQSKLYTQQHITTTIIWNTLGLTYYTECSIYLFWYTSTVYKRKYSKNKEFYIDDIFFSRCQIIRISNVTNCRYTFSLNPMEICVDEKHIYLRICSYHHISSCFNKTNKSHHVNKTQFF